MSSKKNKDKKRSEAADIVARARAATNLSEKEALELAVKETRADRAERSTRR